MSLRIKSAYLIHGKTKIPVSLDMIDISRNASPQFSLKNKSIMTIPKSSLEARMHIWTSNKAKTDWVYDRFNHEDKVDVKIYCDGRIIVKIKSAQIIRVGFHEGDIAEAILDGNQVIMNMNGEDIDDSEIEKVIWI